MIYFDYRGYGRAATHVSADQRYRWLNDSLSVGTGGGHLGAAAGLEDFP